MHEYLNQNLNWTVENMVGYKQLSDQDLWEEKQEFNQWNIQNYIQAAEKKAKETWSHLPATAPRDKSRYGIHILGERHSGTTFLHRHLQECFGHSISIYSNLTRHKYWFQVDDITMDFGFVVGTFRNVYDWLQDMMDKPIHAPLHFDFENNQPFPFQSFLTREWGLDRQRFKKLVQDDLRLMEFYENANANETHGKAIHMESCYENFTFYDIIPCSWEDRNRTNSIVTWSQENLNTDEDDGDFGAVYEMKMDHSPKRLEPYRSILELRRDKIIHLYIEVSKFVSVSHFTAVRYEDLVEMGTSLLVKEIEEKMGIQSQCIPRKLPENVNKRTKKRQKTFLSMVNEGVDWSVEALLGYERIQVGRNSK
jgi:stress-induced morphogen